MKNLILGSTLAVVLVASLFIGYYETLWAEDSKTVWFIKKQPTLKIKFINIFSSDGDLKPLDRLDKEDIENAIDYCRYNRGIETKMKDQKDLDTCAQAYYDTFKKKPSTLSED